MTTPVLSTLLGAAVTPALPALANAFPDASVTLIALLLTLPSLSLAFGSPVAGYIADVVGRKWLLILSLVVYVGGGIAPIWATTVNQILMSRIIVGLASAGTTTSSTALMADYNSSQERAAYMGYQAATMQGIAMMILLSSGTLVDLFGWQGAFYLYFVPLLLIPLSLLSLFEPKLDKKPVKDAADKSPTKGLRWEVYLVWATAFFMRFVFYAIPPWVSFHNLARDDSTSAFVNGATVAAMTFTGLITALNYGRGKALASHSLIFAGIFTVMAGGMFIIAIAPSVPIVFVGTIVFGAGFGWALPNANTWATSIVPGHMRGRVVSGTNFSQFMGQFLSPLAAGPFVEFFDDTSAAFYGAGITALVVVAVYSGLLISGVHQSAPGGPADRLEPEDVAKKSLEAPEAPEAPEALGVVNEEATV